MSGRVDDALGVLRKYVEGHKIIVDRSDGTFDRRLAPSAAPALAAVDVLAGELASQQEWIDRVSLASTEAATAADKAERERDALAVQVEQLKEALRELALAVEEERRWATGTAKHWSASDALYSLARAALEAGSTTPAVSAGNEQ